MITLAEHRAANRIAPKLIRAGLYLATFVVGMLFGAGITVADLIIRGMQ